MMAAAPPGQPACPLCDTAHFAGQPCYCSCGQPCRVVLHAAGLQQVCHFELCDFAAAVPGFAPADVPRSSEVCPGLQGEELRFLFGQGLQGRLSGDLLAREDVFPGCRSSSLRAR